MLFNFEMRCIDKKNDFKKRNHWVKLLLFRLFLWTEDRWSLRRLTSGLSPFYIDVKLAKLFQNSLKRESAIHLADFLTFRMPV